jgi:hypothetical protein
MAMKTFFFFSIAMLASAGNALSAKPPAEPACLDRSSARVGIPSTSTFDMRDLVLVPPRKPSDQATLSGCFITDQPPPNDDQGRAVSVSIILFKDGRYLAADGTTYAWPTVPLNSPASRTRRIQIRSASPHMFDVDARSLYKDALIMVTWIGGDDKVKTEAFFVSYAIREITN